MGGLHKLKGAAPFVVGSLSGFWSCIEWRTARCISAIAGLQYWLIRRSVASLFYLVPATTAMMAHVLFGERLDPFAIAGLIAGAAAVFLADRRAAN